MKASQRNSRKASAKHNIENDARAKLDYIDHSKTKMNQYYIFDEHGKTQRIDGNFDIKTFEQKRYNQLFKDGQDVQNEKYIQQRQNKRCRSTDDIYKSNKTKPMESIFQFSKTDDIDKKTQATITLKAYYDTIKMLKSEYGNNFKPLDFALHMDEKSAHIHSRATFGYMKNGHFVPNQTKALQEMGFEISDPTQPRSKYNNELISFTDQVREYFYCRCEERAKELGLNITIDRNVKSPSKRHKERLSHEVEQLTQKTNVLKAQIQDLSQELDSKDKRLKELEELLKKANKRMKNGIELVDNAHSYTNEVAIQMLDRAKSIFKDIHNDLEEELGFEH